MLNPIEHAAQKSVARACGFGLVAIGTLMIGMAGLLPLAFKCGGLSLLLMCALLLLKSSWVLRQPYRSTETWLILAKKDRPPPEVAQQLISRALRDVYITYARFSAFASAGLLAGSLILGFRANP